MAAALTVLKGLGSPLEDRQRTLLEDVSFRRDGVTIDVAIWPGPNRWTISFDSIVGIKVLDERDLPEYWHVSVCKPTPSHRTFLYQVTQGGWFEQLWSSSKMNEFYGDVQEFFVCGGDWCVVVLSLDRPDVRPTHMRCEVPLGSTSASPRKELP